MANKVGGVVVTPPSAGDANKIVVLLGWMGSTDRQLSKYSALYEQRGCTTVRFIAPGNLATWLLSSPNCHTNLHGIET